MIEKNNIPKHWKIMKLGEVCTYSKGKKPLVLKDSVTKDCTTPYINIKAFEKGIFDEYTNGEKCNLCNNDDLLMVWDGARCGLIGKAKVGAVGSTLMKILPNENIHKEYLYHFISSKFWTLNTKPKGVGIPHIEPTLLWNFEIVVPSISEQQAIVAKIESLLSELENGKKQLRIAQQQLKVYRQSLLKWAFEGKMTNKNVKERKLPKGWKLSSMGSVCEKIQDGSHFSPQVQYDEPGENRFKYITAKNIRNNYMDFRKVVYVDKEYHDSIFGRCNPEFGDVLLTKDGINTGEVTLNTLHEPFSLLSSICLFKTKKEVLNSSYLKYFIQSPLGNKAILESMTGTAIKRIVLRKIKDAKIILPSLPEQQFIVSELESKLTVCDKIEETISLSLQQAETLKQSILKKAFEGKLIAIFAEQKEAKSNPLYKPKNEYFYQMQILGLIAKASKQKQIEHGEMTLAKYAYLMDKVYDIPNFYEYNRWHLGPYPPTIKKAINNKQYFKKSGNHIEVLNEKTLFNSTNPYTEKIQSAVNDLSDIFSKYTANERSHKTELLATVCKVIEDIQTTDLKAVRQSMQEWKIDLKGEIHKTKAEKFNEQETEKCLVFIKRKGWDKKLIK
jgi:type I restriction enzyme, S subunit